MKFIVWLENRENLHSWLNPQGEFISLNGKSHGDYSSSVGLNIDQMFLKGWLRITFYSNKIYAHNDKLKSINYKQKKSLIDLAIENHMSHVILDFGENEKIIWSEFD